MISLESNEGLSIIKETLEKDSKVERTGYKSFEDCCNAFLKEVEKAQQAIRG